jgi:hypothetical protein
MSERGKGRDLARRVRRLRPYWGLFVITARDRLAYPGELALGMSLLAVIFVVFVFVWPAAYGGRPRVGSFSLQELLTYLVVTEAIIMGTPRTWRAIQNDVRSGEVAIALARPVDYLGSHLAQYLGEAMVRVPLAFAVGGAVVLARTGGLVMPTHALPVVLAVFLLALVLPLQPASHAGFRRFTRRGLGRKSRRSPPGGACASVLTDQAGGRVHGGDARYLRAVVAPAARGELRGQPPCRPQLLRPPPGAGPVPGPAAPSLPDHQDLLSLVRGDQGAPGQPVARLCHAHPEDAAGGPHRGRAAGRAAGLPRHPGRASGTGPCSW